MRLAISLVVLIVNVRNGVMAMCNCSCSNEMDLAKDKTKRSL
jgi:hypothetical protein